MREADEMHIIDGDFVFKIVLEDHHVERDAANQATSAHDALLRSPTASGESIDHNYIIIKSNIKMKGNVMVLDILTQRMDGRQIDVASAFIIFMKMYI